MKKKEQGRSTLEMIGVLAILVFLSIGGLQVYSSVQSSLIAAHLEEEVLKEATIKKHENAKADDTDAHEVSHQGPHNTTITSQNGTEGTEQDWFWVTINDINVTVEQKVCQKLLASPKIKEQEWLGLETILVNGKIVETCPEEIQTITYYFPKRKTLNLKDILLDNPDCPNTICPAHATCVERKITTCKAGYKISSNGCQCEKCTERFICDGTKDSKECPYGTKPNAKNTQCDDCEVGAKDVICCPNGAVVSKEKDCDCAGNSECDSGFVCENNICTCQNQAECPLCTDESSKCWDAATQKCIACAQAIDPSDITTQEECEFAGYKWCLGNETCVEKETPCPCDCQDSPNGCRNLDMNFNSCCQVCDTETGLWTPAENGLMRCNLSTGSTDENTGKEVRAYDNVGCYNGEIKSGDYNGNQQECEKYGFYYSLTPEMEYNYGFTGLCFAKKEEADAFYYSLTSDNGEVSSYNYCSTDTAVIFHEDDQSIHYYTEVGQPRPHTGKKIAGIPNAQGACCKENEEIYCDSTNEEGECKKWLCCAKGYSSGEMILGYKNSRGLCSDSTNYELYCVSSEKNNRNCTSWAACGTSNHSGSLIEGIYDENVTGDCCKENETLYCGMLRKDDRCLQYLCCDQNKTVTQTNSDDEFTYYKCSD